MTSGTSVEFSEIVQAIGASNILSKKKSRLMCQHLIFVYNENVICDVKDNGEQKFSIQRMFTMHV